MKTGEQGWLMSGHAGNFEFARLYWFEDEITGKSRYRVGSGGVPKLGPHTLLGVDLADTGATLHWSSGYTSFLPSTWYQATWKLT